MFVLYDGPKICFFSKSYPEMRWSICSCQKFRWVVRSEEAPSHEVRAPVTWMNFSCWEKAGGRKQKKRPKPEANCKLKNMFIYVHDFRVWLLVVKHIRSWSKKSFIDVPYTVHLGDFFFRGGFPGSKWLVGLLDMDVCGFLKPFKGFRKFRRRLHTERCLEAHKASRLKLWSGNLDRSCRWESGWQKSTKNQVVIHENSGKIPPHPWNFDKKFPRFFLFRLFPLKLGWFSSVQALQAWKKV